MIERWLRRWPSLPALSAAVALALPAPVPAGADPVLSERERETIASLSLSALPALTPDTTNRVADLPAAAALGATLFFEQRLSRDGDVACGTCHKIGRQFQDDLPLGKAIGTTDRRTMPLAGVAYAPFQFWDGRRDSLWAQALAPLEDPREHAGNRGAYAHFMKERFRERYERIFGPMPDLSGVPKDAGPLGGTAEKAAWAELDQTGQQAVNEIFANIGKAIAAFERSIQHEPTRFDRFAQAMASGAAPTGDAALSGQEIEGLKLFIGKAECIRCHLGPRFTDDAFHDTAVPQPAGMADDRGHQQGIAKLLADPFNCLGPHRDGPAGACSATAALRPDGPGTLRAFKTPSLRGAATRPPYMHAGQLASLEAVVDHYAEAGRRRSSELRPIDLSSDERTALVAFLRTLAE